MKHTPWRWLPLLLLPVLTACPPAPLSVEDERPELDPFSYDGAPLTAYSTLAIPTLVPDFPPSGTNSYQAAAGLPEGLSLDEDTGHITGTPVLGAVSGDYVIEALDTSADLLGTATVSFTFLAPAPPGVTYPGSPFTLSQLSFFSAMPVVTGVVDSWSVTPPLPSGLQLGSKGQIAGSTVSASLLTDYTIEATNAFGTTAVVIGLEVVDKLVSQTYYVLHLDGTISQHFPIGLASHPVPYTYLLAEGEPVSAVSNATGSRLFVLNFAGEVWSYPIDPVSGRLGDPVLRTTVSGGYRLAFAEATSKLLVLAGTGLFAFDADDDGALTSLGASSASSGASDLAVHPSGEFAYVADGFDGTLSVYALGQTISRLELPLAVLDYSSQLAVHPSGELLFASDLTGVVRALRITAAPEQSLVSQHLAPLPVEVMLPEYAVDLAVAVDGSRLYASVVEGDVVRYLVDGVTGALTDPVAADGGGAPGQLLVDREGKGVHCLNALTSEIMSWTANSLSQPGRERTRRQPIAFADAPGGVRSFDAEILLAADGVQDTVTSFLRNETSGEFEATGQSLDVGFEPKGVAYHPFLDVGYLVTEFGVLRPFQVDTATGAMTPLSGASGPELGDIVELLVDPAGRYAYAVESTGTMWVYALGAGGLPAPATSVAGASAVSSAVIDPTGQFLCVASDASATLTLFRLSLTTGLPSQVDQLDALGPVSSLVFNGNGRSLFAGHVGTGVISIYDLDAETDQLGPGTPATMSVGSGSCFVTRERLGTTVAFLDAGDSQGGLLNTDLWTGAVTAVQTLLALTGTPTSLTQVPNLRAVSLLDGPSGRVLHAYRIIAPGLQAQEALPVSAGTFDVAASGRFKN